MGSWPCACLFAIVILLAALTMMNMLIGVLCEVVSNVSVEEKEKMDLQYVRDKVLEVLECCGLDTRDDEMISKDEFLKLIENDKAIAVLQEVGVDVCTLVNFADFFFQ